MVEVSGAVGIGGGIGVGRYDDNNGNTGTILKIKIGVGVDAGVEAINAPLKAVSTGLNIIDIGDQDEIPKTESYTEITGGALVDVTIRTDDPSDKKHGIKIGDGGGAFKVWQKVFPDKKKEKSSNSSRP